MTATTPGREVDASTLQALRLSYSHLVKAGTDSVTAAWKFGQCIDSFSHRYNRVQLAGAMNLSESTLYRYTRLHFAYQRPEEAVEASRLLETFNIDTIATLKDQLGPVSHGRPLAGRRWQSTCRHCGSHDIAREELTPEETGAMEAEAVPA